MKKADALAPDWRTVRFGDVVRNVDEAVRDALACDLERFVGLEHIDPESLRIKRWGQIADGTSFTRKFTAGQVLFGKRRAYQRKVAVADFDGLCSSDILVFEPADDQLLPELLPFIVQTEGFFQHALGTSAGSLSPRTRWRDLAAYEFALPSPDEQRRVAEILWAAEDEREAFSTSLIELDKLTEVLSRRFFVDNSGERVTFGQLVLDGNLEFQTGPFGTVLKAASYVSEGTPIVNPVNMKEGRFVTKSGPFLSRQECDRLSRYRLLAGDIVLGRKGDVGRGVFVTEEYAGFILGSDCISLRFSGDRMLAKYVFHFLASPQARTWIAHHASGTTMPGINERLLARMATPAPTLEVQNEVVNAYEELIRAREAIQDKMVASLSLKKALTDRLLQR